MPALQLAGTTVLVTGASRDCGRAIAIAVAKQGAHVGVARDRSGWNAICRNAHTGSTPASLRAVG